MNGILKTIIATIFMALLLGAWGYAFIIDSRKVDIREMDRLYQRLDRIEEKIDRLSK